MDEIRFRWIEYDGEYAWKHGEGKEAQIHVFVDGQNLLQLVHKVERPFAEAKRHAALRS